MILDGQWKLYSVLEQYKNRLYFLLLCISVFSTYKKRWVCDDAFISYRYAKNLINGNGLVYNIGERVEGFTNFLWTIIIAAGMLFDIDPINTSYYLGILLFILSLVILYMFQLNLEKITNNYKNSFFFPFVVLSYAFNHHVQVFATGGLETSLFSFLAISGTYFLIFSEEIKVKQLSILIFTLSAMTRPDGLIFIFTSFIYLVLAEKDFNIFQLSKIHKVIGKLIIVYLPFILIFIPYWILRYNYYGWFFPNTFYAKSGSETYFSKGIAYLKLYFSAYYVFLSIPILLIYSMFHKKNSIWSKDIKLKFLLGIALPCILYISYYTKVGGDFMFARFYIPIVSFLYLIIFFILRNLFSKKIYLIFSCLVLLSTIGFYDIYKSRQYPIIDEVSDENKVYKKEYISQIADVLKKWAPFFQQAEVRIAIAGSQAFFAYYLNPPYVLEASNGLTDEFIAHMPLEKRSNMVGHERIVPIEYYYKKNVNLIMNGYFLEENRNYNVVTFNGFPGIAKIIIYDTKKMDALSHIPGINFTNFEHYLDSQYFPNISKLSQEQIIKDYKEFSLYYFDHNSDENRRNIFKKYIPNF